MALSGVLRLEGADPFERAFVLVEQDGTRWRLEPGRFEDQLHALSGHGVRVFCRRASSASVTGAIAVMRYELLPVGGLVPVQGVIRLRGDGVWLESEPEPLVLGGPLAAALAAFDGCRAWVWGERSRRGRVTPGEAVVVEGYVVTGAAAPGF